MRLPRIRLPRKIFTYGALGILASLLGSLVFLGGSTGCYGDQCTGDFRFYGEAEGEGELIDPDTWESTPQVSTWLEYTHKRMYYMRLRGLEGREITQVFAYISPDKNPNVVDEPPTYKQYTLASGNLAEITNKENNQPGVMPLVQVLNDTCADYHLRVVAVARPLAPDAGSPDLPDGGTNQDASSDASNDTGVTE